jgi:hypothetical protein
VRIVTRLATFRVFVIVRDQLPPSWKVQLLIPTALGSPRASKTLRLLAPLVHAEPRLSR